MNRFSVLPVLDRLGEPCSAQLLEELARRSSGAELFGCRDFGLQIRAGYLSETIG